MGGGGRVSLYDIYINSIIFWSLEYVLLKSKQGGHIFGDFCRVISLKFWWMVQKNCDSCVDIHDGGVEHSPGCQGGVGFWMHFCIMLYYFKYNCSPLLGGPVASSGPRITGWKAVMPVQCWFCTGPHKWIFQGAIEIIQHKRYLKILNDKRNGGLEPVSSLISCTFFNVDIFITVLSSASTLASKTSSVLLYQFYYNEMW